MGVRVRVRITGSADSVLETVALLNGGFETGSPYVLLPPDAAARLLPQWAKGKRIRAKIADGDTQMTRPEELVTVTVVAGETESAPIQCAVLVAAHTDEVLLSDTAIDALGVEIRSFGEGLWRLPGEDLVRASEAAELW